MKIQILKSKIHRVRVTGADLNYIGSITIDEDLMDACSFKRTWDNIYYYKNQDLNNPS